MRTRKQQLRAHKRYLQQATASAIREQQSCARHYAHARALYEAGEYHGARYAQQMASKQYMHVRRAQNNMQRYIDGTLLWGYGDLE